MAHKPYIVKRLKFLNDQSHSAALNYIELVTNAAGDQMAIEGIPYDPDTFTADNICELAAKNLEVDVSTIKQNYIDFMVLEKMIEIVEEAHP